MPRTELLSKQADGSPNWIEWNDTGLKADVRLHVKEAVVHKTVISGDGRNREIVQQSDGANDDRMRVALWGHIITGWSYADKGIPVPANNLAGPQVVWSVLDLGDFPVFAEATAELFEQVTANPTPTTSARTSSAS